MTPDEDGNPTPEEIGEAERAELRELARDADIDDEDHAEEHRGISYDLAKLAEGVMFLAKKFGCEDELLAKLNRH